MGVCRSRMGWGVNPGRLLAVPALPALRAHPNGEGRSVCTVRTPQALTQIFLELRCTHDHCTPTAGTWLTCLPTGPGLPTDLRAFQVGSSRTQESGAPS